MSAERPLIAGLVALVLTAAACVDGTGPDAPPCGPPPAFVDDEGAVIIPVVALPGGAWYDPGDAWSPDEPGDPTDEDPNGEGDPQTDPPPPPPPPPPFQANGADDGSGAGDGSGGDISTDTFDPGEPSAPPPACYPCTVACTTDGVNARVARAWSSRNSDDACGAAVHLLETWAHGTVHARLASCAAVEDLPVVPPPRTPPQEELQRPQ